MTNITPLHDAANPNWLELTIKSEGKKPKPLCNYHNAIIALRNAPYLRDRYGYDEMMCAPVAFDQHRCYHAISDADVGELQEWLQWNGLKTISRTIVHDALNDHARQQPFHPLRDWLGNLVWDARPRANVWTVTMLGAENSPYNCRAGEMFLVQMIARIFEPGCKADYMLVLEGPQGALKSSACQILAGKYFSDSLPDLDSDPVRISMHLRGKWLIEISELWAISRAEATKLKAFLTSTIEQYVPKYGRYEIREPRQCVFVGTSNKDQYLRDDTGGRRVWPLKCGTINLDSLERDRDQLLAEAVQLYQEGSPWWPEQQFETDHIAPQQAARYDLDAWAEPISRELETRNSATVLDLASTALSLSKDRCGLTEQKRIVSILRSCGWILKHSRNGNVWSRP